MIDKVHESIQELLELADEINSLAEKYFLSMKIICITSLGVIPLPEYKWEKWTDDARSMSEELTEKYNSWVSTSRIFIKKYSSESEDEFNCISNEMRKLIDRSISPRCSNNRDVFRFFKNKFSIQKNILSSIDYALNNDLCEDDNSFKDAANTHIEVNTISSAEVRDISIEVKNEIIVQFIKPVLYDKINKLKDYVKESEIENKEEIITTCNEILSVEKPSSNWLKRKGQKLLDLCKVESESLEKVSTILQIISTILSILNSNGQVS